MQNSLRFIQHGGPREDLDIPHAQLLGGGTYCFVFFLTKIEMQLNSVFYFDVFSNLIRQ